MARRPKMKVYNSKTGTKVSLTKGEMKLIASINVLDKFDDFSGGTVKFFDSSDIDNGSKSFKNSLRTLEKKGIITNTSGTTHYGINSKILETVTNYVSYIENAGMHL